MRDRETYALCNSYFPSFRQVYIHFELFLGQCFFRFDSKKIFRIAGSEKKCSEKNLTGSEKIALKTLLLTDWKARTGSKWIILKAKLKKTCNLPQNFRLRRAENHY